MKKIYDENSKIISLLFIKGRVIFSRCLTRLKQRMSDKKEGILRFINEPVATEFRNLSPFDKIDNGGEYFKALDWALKDKSVMNIAVSGPYGAGKSSVIETYLRKHPSIKALNISLATFKELDGADLIGDETDELKKKTEQKIEAGILKQLFYKVDYKKIPQSRYRKLYKVSKAVIFRNLMLLFVFFVAIINFFMHSKVDAVVTYIIKTGTMFGMGKKASYLAVLVIVTIVLFISTYLIQWFISSWKSLEIKIADKATFSHRDDDEKSIFNKNLDEIVYFFEATDFDIVFIEDLDRFKSTEIFIKLRELNIILNNYEMIKRRIVFVYAIRDDMFSDKERTKFFDFIVPIIPYINSTNSNELLSKKIEELKNKSEIKYNISDRFITLVSPYISDMRVLTSICNEFVIYKKTLAVNQKINTLNDEKMLSMMIFKNLYPKDFSDLEAEKGIVKQAFEDKEVFIKTEESVLKDELLECESTLKQLSCEMFANIVELKAALLFELSKRTGIVEYVNVNGSQYKFKTIMEEDFDLTLLKGNGLEICYKDVNGSRYTSRIDNIEELYLYKGLNFIERWEKLYYISEENKVDMVHRLENIHTQIYELKALGINKLINIYSSEKVLSEDVRKNTLLVFFLRNTFIDETYVNYINYFHPNSITADEQNFILNVRNYNGAGDFDFKIENCQKVIERLLDTEFRQEEVLNFLLMDCLIKKKQFTSKYSEMLQQLSNRSDISKEFIKQYIDRGKNTKQFIRDIAKDNSGLWEDFQEDPILSEETKIKYLGHIIEFASVDDIKVMNDTTKEVNKITKYIVDNRKILGMLSSVNSQKIEDVISKLGIMFYQMDTAGAKREVVQKIYNSLSFVINVEMLEKYIEFAAPDKINQLPTAHFTTMLEIGTPEIVHFLVENFVIYLDNVILKISTNCQEKLSTILYMFKILNYDYELCVKIVDKEDMLVEDINAFFVEVQNDDNTIPNEINEIMEYIIECDKVRSEWKNIVSVVNEFGVTSNILKFIKRHLQMLLNCNDIYLVDEELTKCILSEKWSENDYRLLLRKLVIEDFTDSFGLYTEEQIRLMIEAHYLDFTPARYDEMKTTYPTLATEYLIQYKELFLSKLNDFTIEITVVDELLVDKRISEQEKKSIVLSKSVDMIDNQMAQWIRNTQESLPKEFVKETWKLLEKCHKYELLKNHIEVFDAIDLQQMFMELDTDYHNLSDRSRKHKVSLYKNATNIVIMKYLKKIQYLSSISEEVDTHTDNVTFETKHTHKIVGYVRKIL